MIVSFAAIGVISVAIGVATGFLASRVMGLVDDHLIELTATVVLAYGSYLLADHFGFSGVIATVTAAIILGNFGPGRTVSRVGCRRDRYGVGVSCLPADSRRVPAGRSRDPAGSIGQSLGPILWGIVGILAGRAIVIYVLLGGASRLWRRPGLEQPVARGWLHVMFWAGLRGAVAVAMALALPADIPQRGLLQEITFGVVLFTLIVQGTTIGRLIDRTVSVRMDPAVVGAGEA